MAGRCGSRPVLRYKSAGLEFSGGSLNNNRVVLTMRNPGKRKKSLYRKYCPGREIEKIITRQPPIGGKDDYDMHPNISVDESKRLTHCFRTLKPAVMVLQDPKDPLYPVGQVDTAAAKIQFGNMQKAQDLTFGGAYFLQMHDFSNVQGVLGIVKSVQGVLGIVKSVLCLRAMCVFVYFSVVLNLSGFPFQMPTKEACTRRGGSLPSTCLIGSWYYQVGLLHFIHRF